MAYRFLLLFSVLILPGFGWAQSNQIKMTDKEILSFLSGNTIGAHGWGITESYEYHSPDGQAIWREGNTVYRGVYRVKNSRVCYTYYKVDFGDWYCWDFKKDAQTGDIYQWDSSNDSYRLYVFGPGDLTHTQGGQT